MSKGLSTQIREIRRKIVEDHKVYGISNENKITIHGKPCTTSYVNFDSEYNKGGSSCHNALQLIAATFHNL